MSFWNKGANDKAQGKNQADPNKLPNDTARKEYQAGHEHQKQKEQQQRQQNKK